MNILKAMEVIDADYKEQSGVSDSEIFKTVNDKIIQAIKERRGQIEIQNDTWFIEGKHDSPIGGGGGGGAGVTLIGAVSRATTTVKIFDCPKMALTSWS